MRQNEIKKQLEGRGHDRGEREDRPDSVLEIFCMFISVKVSSQDDGLLMLVIVGPDTVKLDVKGTKLAQLKIYIKKPFSKLEGESVLTYSKSTMRPQRDECGFYSHHISLHFKPDFVH